MGHRIYRVLLLTLPRGFREEFGREMLQAFSESRRSGVAEAIDVVRLAARLRVDQLRMDVRHAIRGLWQHKIGRAHV